MGGSVRSIRWPLLLALALSALAPIACGGGGGGDGTPTSTSTSTRVRTGGASATAIAQALTVVAQNNLFDVDEIGVQPGAAVAIAFTSLDADPHNIAIYRTSAAEDEIFVGDTFSGPGETATYEFGAPSEPGTYFFRCDVHPITMTGNFVVE